MSDGKDIILRGDDFATTTLGPCFSIEPALQYPDGPTLRLALRPHPYLRPFPFVEAHTRAATVLVDELDARHFESLFGFVVLSRVKL